MASVKTVSESASISEYDGISDYGYCWCFFVGPGRKYDFRVINFLTQPEQRIDTVMIFRMVNQRLLGVSLLSRACFRADIQQEKDAWYCRIFGRVVEALCVLEVAVKVDSEQTCVASVASTGCTSAVFETSGIPVVTFLQGFSASYAL